MTIGSGARYLGPDERAQELKEVFQIVRRNLERAAQKQKYHYNLRRRSWKPEKGDQVLVRQHPLSKAGDKFVAKLAPKFGGPYIVIEFISPVIVRLRAVDNSEERTAHLSELKPYHTANQISSLRIPSSPKQIVERVGEKMDTEEQKFEKSRKKFRQNMEREKAKTRRTIFLNDGERPQSSYGCPKTFKSSSDEIQLVPARSHSQTPPPKMVPPSPLNCSITCESLALKQLPLELQHEIAEKQQRHRGNRARSTNVIHGQQYRITIARNGLVREKRKKKFTQGGGAV